MNDRVVIYKSRKKAVVVTFTGFLLAITGWLFIRYGVNDVSGWSIIILAGFCVIFGIGSWLEKKPSLLLTEKGITELYGRREEIEWDAIRQVDEFYFRGQFFIRLFTDRDYKRDLIQPTWFYRVDRIYAKEGVRAIFIRVDLLEVDSLQLCDFIERMIQADARKRARLLDDFRSSVKRWWRKEEAETSL